MIDNGAENLNGPWEEQSFVWDWFKHEETLATNRANFFLVGEAMLFAGYAAVRAASEALTWESRIFCWLGLVLTGIWLLVSLLHARNTRAPIERRLQALAPWMAEALPHLGTWRERLFRSASLMGIVLPIFVGLAWSGMLVVLD